MLPWTHAYSLKYVEYLGLTIKKYISVTVFASYKERLKHPKTEDARNPYRLRALFLFMVSHNNHELQTNSYIDLA